MIQGQEDHKQYDPDVIDDGTSQHKSSVEWVNTSPGQQHSWDSDGSGYYLVMWIRSQKERWTASYSRKTINCKQREKD